MTDQLLQRLLIELSEAFRAHDPQRLLAQFAERPETTYAGSEVGELATGSAALTELFTRLLERDATYSFVFPDPTWIVAGDSIGVIADGSGTQTAPGCATRDLRLPTVRDPRHCCGRLALAAARRIRADATSRGLTETVACRRRCWSPTDGREVREGGVEPPRPFGQQDLNLPWLPLHHSRSSSSLPSPTYCGQADCRPRPTAQAAGSSRINLATWPVAFTL